MRSRLSVIADLAQRTLNTQGFPRFTYRSAVRDEIQMKGKGFAGVIKRHGFGGGRASHGSMFHRAPGSIGASADPSRVFKGAKLPGHMGVERKTVQNLVVWAVRPELNALLVKGAVPGSKNGFVMVNRALKKTKEDK